MSAIWDLSSLGKQMRGKRNSLADLTPGKDGDSRGSQIKFYWERNMPGPYNLLPALAHLFIKMKKLANASALQVCTACSKCQTEQLTSLPTKNPRSSKAKPRTLGSSVQNPDPLGVKVTLWSCAPTNVCQGVCKT